MHVFINEHWKTIFCSQRNMSCRQWMLIKTKQIFVSKSVSRTHEIVLRNKKVFSQKKSQSFASWPGWLASCLLSCEQSRSDLIDATFYAFSPSQCWWWQLYVGTELVDEFELFPCCSTNDQTSPLSTFGSPLVQWLEPNFKSFINHKSNMDTIVVITISNAKLFLFPSYHPRNLHDVLLLYFSASSFEHDCSCFAHQTNIIVIIMIIIRCRQSGFSSESCLFVKW